MLEKQEAEEKRRAEKAEKIEVSDGVCPDCERRENMEAYDNYIDSLGPNGYGGRMSYEEFVRQWQEERRPEESIKHD